jgi:hypothetical protein
VVFLKTLLRPHREHGVTAVVGQDMSTPDGDAIRLQLHNYHYFDEVIIVIVVGVVGGGGGGGVVVIIIILLYYCIIT